MRAALEHPALPPLPSPPAEAALVRAAQDEPALRPRPRPPVEAALVVQNNKTAARGHTKTWAWGPQQDSCACLVATPAAFAPPGARLGAQRELIGGPYSGSDQCSGARAAAVVRRGATAEAAVALVVVASLAVATLARLQFAAATAASAARPPTEGGAVVAIGVALAHLVGTHTVDNHSLPPPPSAYHVHPSPPPHDGIRPRGAGGACAAVARVAHIAAPAPPPSSLGAAAAASVRWAAAPFAAEASVPLIPPSVAPATSVPPSAAVPIAMPLDAGAACAARPSALPSAAVPSAAAALPDTAAVPSAALAHASRAAPAP